MILMSDRDLDTTPELGMARSSRNRFNETTSNLLISNRQSKKVHFDDASMVGRDDD